MFLITIFIVSGLGVIALVSAKVWEERKRRRPLLLKLVSLGNERVRILSHEAAHRYSEYRGDMQFFFEKQLPLHSRNIANKAQALIKEKSEKYIEEVRNSKFFKKDEGISEFFKSIAEKESDSQNEDSEVK